jgi:hypothetical protein
VMSCSNGRRAETQHLDLLLEKFKSSSSERALPSSFEHEHERYERATQARDAMSVLLRICCKVSVSRWV